MHELLENIPDWLHILIVSFVPVLELRGSIPYAILVLDCSYLYTLFFAIIGSFLPCPIIVLFFQKMMNYLASKPRFAKFYDFMQKFAVNKSEKLQTASFWGLLFFVAVPLPGTGVWSGSLAASILEMDPKKATIACLAGTSIAGVIITVLVHTGMLLAV